MNKTNKTAWPLLAIHHNGETIELTCKKDLEKFFHTNGKWEERHEIHIPVLVEGHYEWRTIINNWIVRDFYGRKVSVEDVKEYLSSPYGYYNRLHNAKVRAIAAKGLPIPRTGCRKAGWKQNAPAKKNSGKKHHLRNFAKINYDMKIHELPQNVRIEKGF